MLASTKRWMKVWGKLTELMSRPSGRRPMISFTNCSVFRLEHSDTM